MGREITNYDAEYARRAQEYADDEPMSGGQFITTKGGVMKFGELEMPGNQIAVVIVDSVWENTYYTERFNDDDPMPPKCYAFARGADRDTMAPLIAEMDKDPYFEAQSRDCAACEWNEWGSADTGSGKACQNRRRLALLPAGVYEKERGSREFKLQLFDEKSHYEKADLAFLKLPVTSVKAYSAYVQQITASLNKPPFGVVTRIWCEPDSRTQYKLHFELIEEMPDYLSGTIFKRNDEARKTIITPYAPPRENERDRGRGRGRGRGRDDNQRARGRDDDRPRGRDRDDERGRDDDRGRDDRRTGTR